MDAGPGIERHLSSEVELSTAQVSVLERLYSDWQSRPRDQLRWDYYRGAQRIASFGLSIPEKYRAFYVISNWPRVVVDTIADRQRVRGVILPGDSDMRESMRDLLDRVDFDNEFTQFNISRLVTGRGYMSVGMAEDGHAVVRAEPASEVSALRDPRTGATVAAVRFFGDVDPLPVESEAPQIMRPALTARYAQLYTTEVIAYYEHRGAEWEVQDLHEHRLGYCPMQYYANRATTSGGLTFSGSDPGFPGYESEIADIVPLTDAAARALTDLQFAQSATGAPFRWMAGVTAQDFQDDNGNQMDVFQAYFGALQLIKNEQAKVGELRPSDLQNFKTALEVYGTQAAILTGFPSRYFGHFTANPPNEASMKADEAVLVRRIERQNSSLGPFLARVAALAHTLETGEAVDPRMARTEWYDVSTPTEAQRGDALMKQRSVGVLSRRGYWTGLGWSKERMDQEEMWLRQEAEDDLAVEVAGGIKAALRRSEAPAEDSRDSGIGGFGEDTSGTRPVQ